MWVPTWFILIALVGAPVAMLIGLATGAFLYHRGYTGVSPLPTADEIKRVISRPEPEPDKPKPANFPVMRI
jgi:hypothetical protein